MNQVFSIQPEIYQINEKVHENPLVNFHTSCSQHMKIDYHENMPHAACDLIIIHMYE